MKCASASWICTKKPKSSSLMAFAELSDLLLPRGGLLREKPPTKKLNMCHSLTGQVCERSGSEVWQSPPRQGGDCFGVRLLAMTNLTMKIDRPLVRMDL
jgi:hypothetical protein